MLSACRPLQVEWRRGYRAGVRCEAGDSAASNKLSRRSAAEIAHRDRHRNRLHARRTGGPFRLRAARRSATTVVRVARWSGGSACRSVSRQSQVLASSGADAAPALSYSTPKLRRLVPVPALIATNPHATYRAHRGAAASPPPVAARRTSQRASWIVRRAGRSDRDRAARRHRGRARDRRARFIGPGCVVMSGADVGDDSRLVARVLCAARGDRRALHRACRAPSSVPTASASRPTRRLGQGAADRQRAHR